MSARPRHGGGCGRATVFSSAGMDDSPCSCGLDALLAVATATDRAVKDIATFMESTEIVAGMPEWVPAAKRALAELDTQHPGWREWHP